MEKTAVWVIYFQAIVAMQHHPGAGTRGHIPLTLHEAADIADEMLRLTEERINASINRSSTP